nr:ABC transporter substrate-binding protein [Dehalococcoidales bacterium]
MENPGKHYIKRRDFLKLGAAAAGIGLLQACQPAAPPAPTAAPTATAQPTPVKPAAQVPQVPQLPTAAPTQAPTVAPTKPAGPKKGGTFTMAKTSGITQFDPLDLFAGNYAHQRGIFNTLVRYDPNLKPIPELAEKWDFSADGKQVTFKLREGVKFHSGREFTSDDVKKTVEFAQQDTQATMRTLYKTIKKVDTPDKYTVGWGFDTANPGVFDILDTLYIIDYETIEDRKNTAIGTGPFKLDKYVPNDSITMVANKDYWEEGKPYVDKFIIRTIPDLASLAINLESGAVDAIWNLSYVDLARFKKDPKYVADLGAPGALLYDVAINVTKEPFTNKKARQAVGWSIDRQRFVDTALKGLVQPTCLIWPRHSWAYFPDLEGKIGYDLDKAKSLLKEAGLDGGFQTEILVSSKRNYGDGDLAQILQADLKKINIDATISDVDPSTYTSRTNAADIVLMIHTYGRANRDPGTTVTGAKAWYNKKEGNWCEFESDKWDQLRKDMQSTLDQDKRKAVARQIQEMALDECFTIPVAPAQRSWAYPIYVKVCG